MDIVELEVSTALPALSDQEVSTVLAKLKEIGVQTGEDLRFLEEPDLRGVLKPIQIRRFLSTVKRGDGSVPESGSSFSTTPPCTSPLQVPSVPDTQQHQCESKASNVDPNWPVNFQVCWESMPPQLISALKKKERPSSRLRREMVRLVVDQARAMCERPLKKHYEIIARRIVGQYPASFQDAFEGTVVGTGHDSLLNQLVFRTENCVRFKNRCSGETADLTKSGRKKARMYGCFKDSTTENIDEECLEEKKETLKHWYVTNTGQKDDIKAEMKATYLLQRKMIDSKIKTPELLSEWPYLFMPDGMFIHFHELVGIHVEDVLPVSFKEKGLSILKFAQQCEKSDAATQILAELEDAPGTELQNQAVAVTLLLLHYLEENEGAVFIVRGDPCTARDVEQSDLPASPRIIVIGDSAWCPSSFMLSVDKIVVTDLIDDFITAISVWFALHYVLNLVYAQESQALLEFLQRTFLGINPDRGSRAEKRQRTPVNKKVLRLVDKLSHFEWHV
ncbi:uncharacterized protein LOC135391542 isoform X1 [Ornithodoros turicata]|uniref:uncharacterized protein LOC135391542 isoform X1 n=1 Tax=Ornithodoros turicata TaxID=34597 RepID=UPI003139D818